MKFCRRFERFAASLVRCLSEASCARKTSESATVQNGVHKFPGLDLLYSYFVFLIYNLHDLFKSKFTNDNDAAVLPSEMLQILDVSALHKPQSQRN